jgi:hypothetical protein
VTPRVKILAQDSTTRREWLARWARVSILAGLAALIVRLFVRAPDSVCRRPASRCHECGLLAQCGTPRASLERKHG